MKIFNAAYYGYSYCSVLVIAIVKLQTAAVKRDNVNNYFNYLHLHKFCTKNPFTAS